MGNLIFEDCILFLHDELWRERYGYTILSNGEYMRFSEPHRLPPVRWDIYKHELESGYLPTLQEFAGWHPLDQLRFQIDYVYRFNRLEKDLYYNKKGSELFGHSPRYFFAPLNVLKFYYFYLNSLSLDFSGFRLETLEIYHIDFLSFKLRYELDINDFRVVHSRIESYDDLLDLSKDSQPVSLVINDCLVYATFYGRTVYDVLSSHVNKEFKRALDSNLLSIAQLSLLSQEGY